MRTRAKPKAPSAGSSQTEDLPKLPEADGNPPRLLIVNDHMGEDATIITLSHPRTLKPNNYFMCPRTGIYEIRSSGVDPSLKRSVILDSYNTATSPGSPSKDTETQNDVRDVSSSPSITGYVLEDAITYSITPIDPLFLLLPALRAATSKPDSERGHFRSAEDILESFFEQSQHLSRLVKSPLRPLLEQRMAVACDTVEAGDETMYRLSEQKLLAEIMKKARRMSTGGLPPSIEDKFVSRLLEIPLYAAIQADSEADVAKSSVLGEHPPAEKSESQSTLDSNISNESFESQGSADTSITVPEVGESKNKVSDEVTQLQRLRTAINMMLSLYVPKHIASALRRRLESVDSGLDFTPLNKHLEFLAKAKADAAAARSMGDFSHKRGFDDDEVSAERAEKKRKKDEEEKRKKAGESRGVRDLKKVNVNGMKKMSDFFKKAPGK